MGRFHNINYDGVVLKIPILFRDKEKGGHSLQKIKDIIQDEIIPNNCISGIHPDYSMTRNELDSWDEKKEYIREREQKKNERQKRRREREQRVKDYKMFDLVWKIKYELIDLLDGMRIMGKHYEYNDILNKSNIKKSFRDTIQSMTFEERLRFFENKNYCIKFNVCSEHSYNEKVIRIPDDFIYYSKSADAGLKFDRLFVNIFDREAEKNIYFMQEPLYYDYVREEYFISIRDDNRFYKKMKDQLVERKHPVGANNENRTRNYRLFYFDDYNVDIRRKKIRHKDI